MKISERTFWVAVDFFILISIVALLCICYFGIRLLLYPGSSYIGELQLITQPLEDSFAQLLCVGDTVYDTLTKRRVGEVTAITEMNRGDGSMQLTLAIDAERMPRGRALRTRYLWFEYTVTDNLLEDMAYES